MTTSAMLGDSAPTWRHVRNFLDNISRARDPSRYKYVVRAARSRSGFGFALRLSIIFPADGMNEIGEQFRQWHDHEGVCPELDVEWCSIAQHNIQIDRAGCVSCPPNAHGPVFDSMGRKDLFFQITGLQTR